MNDKKKFEPRRFRIYKLSTFDALTDEERKFHMAYKEAKKEKVFLNEQRDNLIASFDGVNNNDKLKESYEEKKTELETWRDKWSDVTNSIQNSINDQYAAQILGQNLETNIFTDRQKNLTSMIHQNQRKSLRIIRQSMLHRILTSIVQTSLTLQVLNIW